MTDSYRALANDFYVNQKLAVKMELPKGRDAVLDLFERVRRQFPSMANFKRFRDELALESPQTDQPHRWIALRGNTLRTGVVNPPSGDPEIDPYDLHRFALEQAPYFLNIPALDVDYLELLFGFDLAATGNQDAIVYDALLAGSPWAALANISGTTLAECQPLMGMTVQDRDDLHIQIEVKTHPAQPGQPRSENNQPISVYLTLRRFGSVSDLSELPQILADLGRRGEELVNTRIAPGILNPLRNAIASGNA